MRTVLLSLMFLLTISIAASAQEGTSSAGQENAVQEKLVAHVLVPFIPVYRERRPESEILIQAKKGDRFSVAQVGQYWARVFVPPNNEMGWIELGMASPKVEIIEETDKSPLLRTFIFPAIIMALIVALITGLRAYQNNRHKKALEHAGPERPRL
ncbi:MAG: hypothetical protein JNL74_10070 [Fibrobacteres bacterium]|nr:hypothetical protein [Fibrobacterota bacterium]